MELSLFDDDVFRYAEPEPMSGCWIWMGKRVMRGYGVYERAPGRREERCPQREMAHRTVYRSLVGPIPKGLVIDHLCKNTSCVNPAHLQAVTQFVNLCRSTGIVSKFVAQTTAPCGHDYDMQHKDDGRRCRACRNSQWRARYHKKAAARRMVATSVDEVRRAVEAL